MIRDKMFVTSTMKTWQVDFTANHSFPLKKYGLFGRKQSKTPIELKEMLSGGQKFFEPTPPQW